MALKTKIKKEDIKIGEAKSYKIGDVKIVVCNLGDKYCAISDVCSHDDGELVSTISKITDNCQIECPRHGARFDVRTGRATRMPAVAAIKTYEVVEKGDELEIALER